MYVPCGSGDINGVPKILHVSCHSGDKYKWGPKVAEMRRLTQRKWPCLASQVSCTAKQVALLLTLQMALNSWPSSGPWRSAQCTGS